MSGGSDISPDSGVNAVNASQAHARLDWVDALKGIGIVAVIAGHVWTYGPVRDAIYTVHMPLFFILSGYTARHVPWRILLASCLRRLALPFLCFSALLLAADFLIEGMRGVRPIFESWQQGATTILFATERLRGPFTILWFIPCLLLSRLVWNALVANGPLADGWGALLVMFAVGVLAIFANDIGGRSPLGLLAVPGALLLIWAGALWRQWGPLQRFVLMGFGVVTVVTLVWFPPVNMKMGDLGWPVASLAGAIAVTVTLGRLVQCFPLSLVVAFAALGRASLVIMYVHVAFIHYLAPYAPPIALFLVALAMSCAVDWTVRRSRLARLMLLGERTIAR